MLLSTIYTRIMPGICSWLTHNNWKFSNFPPAQKITLMPGYAGEQNIKIKKKLSFRWEEKARASAAPIRKQRGMWPRGPPAPQVKKMGATGNIGRTSQTVTWNCLARWQVISQFISPPIQLYYIVDSVRKSKVYSPTESVRLGNEP